MILINIINKEHFSLEADGFPEHQLVHDSKPKQMTMVKYLIHGVYDNLTSMITLILLLFISPPRSWSACMSIPSVPRLLPLLQVLRKWFQVVSHAAVPSGWTQEELVIIFYFPGGEASKIFTHHPTPGTRSETHFGKAKGTGWPLHRQMYKFDCHS